MNNIVYVRLNEKEAEALKFLVDREEVRKKKKSEVIRNLIVEERKKYL